MPFGLSVQSGQLTMSRSPSPFKKTDVVRLIEAARAAGMRVTGVEVTPDGTLRALETAPAQTPMSDFDRLEQEL